MNFAGQRWWLVGASEGLGRALAVAMAAAGAKLVVSARNEARLSELASTLPNAQAIAFDVSDGEAVARAVAEVGAVDGVIYCAGAYTPMSANNWQSGAAEQMAEVNFMGALRVLSGVVPGMVKTRAGRIVLIGSLSGFRGLPGAIGYGASKAGLMHLAENLAVDLQGSGVEVQLVNPGFIETRLTALNDFKMPMIMSAEAAAEQVIAAIASGRFQSNFPRRFSWLFRAAQFWPMWVHRRVFRPRG